MSKSFKNFIRAEIIVKLYPYREGEPSLYGRFCPCRLFLYTTNSKPFQLAIFFVYLFKQFAVTARRTSRQKLQNREFHGDMRLPNLPERELRFPLRSLNQFLSDIFF